VKKLLLIPAIVMSLSPVIAQKPTQKARTGEDKIFEIASDKAVPHWTVTQGDSTGHVVEAYYQFTNPKDSTDTYTVTYRANEGSKTGVDNPNKAKLTFVRNFEVKGKSKTKTKKLTLLIQPDSTKSYRAAKHKLQDKFLKPILNLLPASARAVYWGK